MSARHNARRRDTINSIFRLIVVFWIPAPRRVTVYTSRSIAPRIVGTMGMRRFSFAVARLLLGCARADRRPKHGRSCRRSSRGSSFNRSRNLIRRIKFRRVRRCLNSKCSKHEAARPHLELPAAMADHGAGERLEN